MISFVANIQDEETLEAVTFPDATGIRGMAHTDNVITPGSFWYNGATYVVGMGEDDVNNAPVIVKWKDGVVSFQETVGVIDNNNFPLRHNWPAVWVINGWIYVFVVNGHGHAIKIFKSNTQENVTDGFSLHHTIAGEWGYVNLWMMPDNRMVIHSRVTNSQTSSPITANMGTYSQVIFISAVNDLTSWTTVNTTLTGDIKIRHYPGSWQHYGNNEWMYAGFVLRDHDGVAPTVENYFGHAIYKTKDFDTLYNLNETFNKKISVEGVLTPAEIESHFTITGSINKRREYVSGLEGVIINDIIFCSYFEPIGKSWYFRKIFPSGIIKDFPCNIPLTTEPDPVQRPYITIYYNGNNLFVITRIGTASGYAEVYGCDFDFGNMQLLETLYDFTSGIELSGVCPPYVFPEVTGEYIIARGDGGNDSINYAVTDNKFLITIPKATGIEIINPVDSAEIFEGDILINTNINGSGTSKVDYFLDEQLLGSVLTAPFDRFLLEGTASGLHDLRADLYVNGVLTSSDEISFTVNESMPNIIIEDPLAAIATEEILASKMGISSQQIISFSRVNNRVQAFITATGITLSDGAFRNVGITSFEDLDGIITAVDIGSAWRENPQLKLAYLPGLPEFAWPELYNASFKDVHPDIIIYANIAASTCNNGAPDPDLVNDGYDVRFIENFDAPSAITDLSIATAYATAFKLSFTQPASVNPIESYEVYVEGVFNGRYGIGNEIYATGLAPNASHDITVVAVDEFYNKSEISNSVSGSTSTTLMPLDSLLTYHNFEQSTGKAIDLWGGYHGIVSGTTRGIPGKIGNAYSYDGVNDHVDITGIVSASKDYTFSFWMDSSTRTGGYEFIFDSELGRLVIAIQTDGKLGFFDGAWKTFGVAPVAGMNHYFVVLEGTKGLLYINNVKQATEPVYSPKNLGGTVRIGRSFAGTNPLKASIDEFSIHEKVVTSTERDIIYNNGNGLKL